MKKIIYYLGMFRSRKAVIKLYGAEFWKNFKSISYKIFNDIMPLTPDIGDSIFKINFQCASSYVAWYKSMKELGLSQRQSNELMWLINEKMFTTIPRKLMHLSGKIYLNSFRKKAKKQIERQNNGMCHPYDWDIKFRNIDKNSYEIDILKCEYIDYAKKFGAEGMLPGICRIDYLLANLMGNGFRRTKTLGDKDSCCNCHYELTGKCEWAPEKGFITRK